MIKGNMGGGGAPSLDNVDLSHAKTLECEECGVDKKLLFQLPHLLVRRVVISTKNFKKLKLKKDNNAFLFLQMSIL